MSIFNNWLNIFNNDGKVGGINLVNLNRSFHNIVCSKEYSNQIINAVIDKIENKHTEFNNVELLKQWLEKRENEVSENGIEKRLSEIDFHKEVNPEIIIPFTNKYADKNIFHEELLELINQNGYSVFTIDEIENCLKKSDNINGFIEKLVETRNHYSLNDLDAECERLKQLYYSPRKKPDTDKAIFRLSSIGIIDDYTVDYNKNCYKIRILKKTDDEYIEHLKVFMRKYYSANRVESEIENVFTAKGDTILQSAYHF